MLSSKNITVKMNGLGWRLIKQESGAYTERQDYLSTNYAPAHGFLRRGEGARPKTKKKKTDFKFIYIFCFLFFLPRCLSPPPPLQARELEPLSLDPARKDLCISENSTRVKSFRFRVWETPKKKKDAPPMVYSLSFAYLANLSRLSFYIAYHILIIIIYVCIISQCLCLHMYMWYDVAYQD